MRRFALATFLLAAALGYGRAAAVRAATVPSDPAELMVLAAKSNGLAGDGLQPWHLKASYTEFDAQGT